MRFYLLLLLVTAACTSPKPDETIILEPSPPKPIVFDHPSTLENEYLGFHSPKAINTLVSIENEHFNSHRDSISRYYGTEWKKQHQVSYGWGDTATSTIFGEYLDELERCGLEGDSMHCTIYAMKSLKAGLGSNFVEVDEYHKSIWKDREYAGWSIAYILTKYYDWKAYLFLSEYSPEYERCLKNFKRNKKYYVWKQPDIPIERLYNFDTEQAAIDSLLLQNEFGWGFSYQGLHTWITRFDTLKECNWAGSPSERYGSFSYPLFVKTKFTYYQAYASHIIVFPPKGKG